MNAGPPSQEAVEEALTALHRRGFLQLAGAVAATTLFPSGCGAVSSELVPPPERVPFVLSARGYATFQAFSMSLVGPALAREIRTRALDPASAADAWVARQPALARTLGQGLVVLEWGVWPLLAKWRPFTALGDAERERVLARLAVSRIELLRDLYRGLKSLATLAVYTDPAARRVLGHPGPFAAEGIALAMRPLPAKSRAGGGDASGSHE